MSPGFDPGLFTLEEAHYAIVKVFTQLGEGPNHPEPLANIQFLI